MDEIERRKLAPKEGGLVRIPGTKQPLPAEGKTVEMTRYWRLRLHHGDVVDLTDTPPTSIKKGATA